MPLSQAQLDRAFELLERRAIAGERCPENGTHGIESNLTSALARVGRIRIHIYAHNWRAVEIMEGPYKGAITAPHPNPNVKPWRTIGTEDNRRITIGMRQPSAPRVLSPSELKA